MGLSLMHSLLINPYQFTRLTIFFLSYDLPFRSVIMSCIKKDHAKAYLICK